LGADDPAGGQSNVIGPVLRPLAAARILGVCAAIDDRDLDPSTGFSRSTFV